MVSSSVSTTTAFSSTSSAPAARQTAFSAGKSLGATRYRRFKPMFFMARAAPPILPGWVVFTNTMRMLSNAGAVIVGSHAVGIAQSRKRHRKRRAFYHEHYVRKPPPGARRSEEHTSELQSRGHLVCRL